MPSQVFLEHLIKIVKPAAMTPVYPAGVPHDVLQEVGKAVTEIPMDFNPHRLIKKLFQQRRDMITGDQRKPLVDWGMAETLAFGTLISEGGALSSHA